MLVGAALAVAGAGFVAAANWSSASIGGTTYALTASDGSTSIAVDGHAGLNVGEQATDAVWSPDGSRVAYLNANGAIDSARYNSGTDLRTFVDPIPAGDSREHPTWSENGSALVWAEKPSGGAWGLMITSASPGSIGDPLLPPDPGFDYTHPDFGPGSMLVFQKQAGTAGTPEVDLIDLATGTTSTVVTDARHPAISPDGKKVAFVRSDGAATPHDQIYIFDRNTSAVTQITSDGENHDNPVWAPAGDEIAFNTGTAVKTAAPTAGSSEVATTLTGVPAYQPSHTDRVVRLAGSNRYATAVDVSQSHWATAGATGDGRQAAKSVVLSRSDTFADALSGSALAAAKEGPLLMTLPTGLNAATQAEISRVLAPNTGATVYLLGGTGALSTTVEDAVKAMGYTVVRLAGSNRYGTSVAIANAITPSPDFILAATGLNFPDALAAGAAAGSYDVPGSPLSAVVVLTADASLPTATQSYLDANPNSLIIGIGGQASTATAAYGGLGVIGKNRYQTASYTAEVFFGGEHYAGVATGLNWPDALSGGALMATLNGPVLLTDTSALSTYSAGVLDESSGSIATGILFGGTGAIGSAVDPQVGQWLSGPGGFTQVLNPTDVGPAAAPQRAAMKAAAPATVSDHRTAEELRKAAAQLPKAG